MTESNQGPATPGTAARCEEPCGLGGSCVWGPSIVEGHEVCCLCLRLRAAPSEIPEIERLKAENASLRANVDQLVGDVQAIAQDYTNAAGALRWIADWDKQPVMMVVARTLHYDMAAKARAALSGEEAAGAAEPPSEVVPEPLPTRASLLESLRAAEDRAVLARSHLNWIIGFADTVGQSGLLLNACRARDALLTGLRMDEPQVSRPKAAPESVYSTGAALHDEERSAPQPEEK